MSFDLFGDYQIKKIDLSACLIENPVIDSHTKTNHWLSYYSWEYAYYAELVSVIFLIQNFYLVGTGFQNTSIRFTSD